MGTSKPADSSPTSLSSKGSGKVSKKRVKAERTPKMRPAPFIRKLSADKSDFRDIVHRFTGQHLIPSTSPFVVDQSYWPGSAPGLASSQCDALLVNELVRSLRALNTISTYLLFLQADKGGVNGGSQSSLKASCGNVAGSVPLTCTDAADADEGVGLSSLFTSQLHNAGQHATRHGALAEFFLARLNVLQN